MKDPTIITLGELPTKSSKSMPGKPNKKLIYPCLVKVISLPTQYFDPKSIARETNDIYALIENSIPRIKISARQKVAKTTQSQTHLKNVRASGRYGSNKNIHLTKVISMSVEKCKGWFEVLSEDEKAAPGISSVSDLATKFPDSCLVRKEIWAYNFDELSNDRPNCRIIRKGELLGLIGVENKSTMTTALMQTKAPGLPFGLSYGMAPGNEQYLRCIDYLGTTWYLALGSKGYFSPIAKRENISGVHSLKDIAQKFYLPLKVKLVHYHCGQEVKVGNKLRTLVPEGSVLRLMSATREYDFEIYLLSSEGIKKLRLPYSCARKMFVQYPTDLHFVDENYADLISDINPTIRICLALLDKMNLKNTKQISKGPQIDQTYQAPLCEKLYDQVYSTRPVYANHPSMRQKSLFSIPASNKMSDYQDPSKEHPCLSPMSNEHPSYKTGTQSSQINPILNNSKNLKLLNPFLTPCPGSSSLNNIYHSKSLSDGSGGNNEKGCSLRTSKSDQTCCNSIIKHKLHQTDDTIFNDHNKNRIGQNLMTSANSPDLAFKLHSLISNLVIKDNGYDKCIKITKTTQNIPLKSVHYACSNVNKLNYDKTVIKDRNYNVQSKYQYFDAKGSKPVYENTKKQTTIIHKLKQWISNYVKDNEYDESILYYNVENKTNPIEYQSYHFNNCLNY